MSDSVRPHRWQPGPPHPWVSPGKNTGVGSLSLLQQIFLTRESNRGLLHWRWVFTKWAIREAQLHREHVIKRKTLFYVSSRDYQVPRTRSATNMQCLYSTNFKTSQNNIKIGINERKFCLVKAMVFPVIVYGCESWTMKKDEHWKTDAFDLWCWRKLLRVPWTARSNQLILKEISPEYSLEELMLKMKLQYFGHLMGRTDSLEKTLMLGKIEGEKRRGRPRMRWLDGIQLNGHEFE